jgi:hypothetical protein
MSEEKKRKRAVKCGHMTYALLLEELLSGPSTAQQLADHAGMGVIFMCRLLNVLHKRGVIHVSGWERDTAGRMSIRAFSLGHGKDAKRPAPKSRQAINRSYRNKVAAAPLVGTPWSGLGAMNDSTSRRAA